MINVEEARRYIFNERRDYGEEVIAIDDSYGRCLRETLIADRDLPPFDRVMMDGIAIQYDTTNFNDAIIIEGVIAAGEPKAALKHEGNCFEIMTGAVLPEGCDTVIRYEDVDISDGMAKVNTNIVKGQNIHAMGIDRKEGDLLVTPGVIIGSAEIGVAAAIGKTNVRVSRLPKCLVVSTGDELVEIHEQPAAHQIRRGNVFRISSSLRQMGLDVSTAHLSDDLPVIVENLKQYLDHYDLLIFSGGVSKGKFDYLPEAFEEVGIQKKLHRVAQRPGKPLWFGTHSNGTVVFGLPGNPISSFMCTTVYVVPWIRNNLGILKSSDRAVLSHDVSFKPNLTYFLEVRLSQDGQGQLIAEPMKGHGSGDLANLVKGDAFIELPEGRDRYFQGEVYSIHRYR